MPANIGLALFVLGLVASGCAVLWLGERWARRKRLEDAASSAGQAVVAEDPPAPSPAALKLAARILELRFLAERYGQMHTYDDGERYTFDRAGFLDLLAAVRVEKQEGG